MCALKAHEDYDYQHFLISDERESLVPPQLYLNALPEKIDTVHELNILDLGCGLGYVSIILGQKYLEYSNVHIYGCDYQEDLLDEFWKRIVSRNLNNVTAFHLAERSKLHFPGWLPQMHHVFISMMLSTSEDADIVLDSLKPVLSPAAYIHIIDWHGSREHEFLDYYYPPKKRLTSNIIEQFATVSGFDVLRTVKDNPMVFLMTARLNTEEAKPIQKLYQDSDEFNNF